MGTTTVTDLLPRYVAKSFAVLRENATFARLVVKDGKQNMPASQGETINFPVPPEPQATSDVTPSNTSPDAGDTKVETTPLTIGSWKKADFKLSEKQQLEIADSPDFVNMMLDTKARELANLVNADIASLYKYVNLVDLATVPGSSATAFASDLKAANRGFAKLNGSNTPRDPRALVIDFDTESDAKNLSGFSSALESGSTDVKVEGMIGRKFGMNWFGDSSVPVHTAGAGSGYVADGAQTSASVAAGPLKSLLVKTGTGTLKAGDILTIAGATETQVVAADYAGGAGTVTFTPGIPYGTTIADGAAITKLASHRANLILHPWAFGAAFRSLPPIGNSPNLMRSQFSDPVTGLSLALEVSYQYHQWKWELSILYGKAALRPRLACRVIGGNLT
jgi:hypothetical protein